MIQNQVHLGMASGPLQVVGKLSHKMQEDANHKASKTSVVINHHLLTVPQYNLKTHIKDQNMWRRLGVSLLSNVELNFTFLKISKYILHEKVVISKPVYNWEWIIKTNHYLRFKMIASEVKKRPQCWHEVYKMFSTYSILVPCFCGTYSSPYLQFPDKCIRFLWTETVALSSFSLSVNVLTWYILQFFIQRSFCYWA